jgi:hypothetical protein
MRLTIWEGSLGNSLFELNDANWIDSDAGIAWVERLLRLQ